MATLTIRSFPDKQRDRLRKQAKANGRSMEAEARRLVLEGLSGAEDTPGPSKPGTVDKDWLKKLQRVAAKSSKRDRLSTEERRALAPDAQVALQRLREMFADRKGEPKRSMVDEFLANRREMWGEE